MKTEKKWPRRGTCPRCGREVLWFGRYSYHQCLEKPSKPIWMRVTELEKRVDAIDRRTK